MSDQPVTHGHLDQWDEFFPVTEHAHKGGDKAHRHTNQPAWTGIRPASRYVPPSLLDRPFMVADWTDTSDLSL